MNVLLAAVPDNLSIVDGLGYSVLGIVIVFVALRALWGIIAVMSAIYKKTAGRKKAVSEAEPSKALPSAAAPALPAASGQTAPGSAGQIKIHDVPEKTAAILMAIVANKMNRPLNELRFISIKEVK